MAKNEKPLRKRWAVTQNLVWLKSGGVYKSHTKYYRFRWMARMSARMNRGTPANYILSALFRLETELREVETD